jgi:hypothetical protein
VEALGTAELNCLTSEGIQVVTLKNVRLVPGVGTNLASLRKMLEGGAKVKGSGDRVSLLFKGEVMLEAINHKSMLVNQEEEPTKASSARSEQSAELWYRRLSHASPEVLAEMAERNLVQDLSVSAEKFRSLKEEVCEPCILAKQTRSRFPKASESHTDRKPLDLLLMDLCGPLQVKSLGGSRYILTITDDASRCSIVKFLSEKSQAKKAITQVVKQLERQLGSKVKEFRTDRGREFLNKEMAQFCSEEGIIHELTCPYTPEQNGVAERLNRTLLEKARAMIKDAGLSSELWAEAVNTANFVKNRTLSRTHGKTPFEVLTGDKPSISNLKVFGCPCYVHVPALKRKKLDPVSEKGTFLGYEPHTKGYRILKGDGSIQVSRDVTF